MQTMRRLIRILSLASLTLFADRAVAQPWPSEPAQQPPAALQPRPSFRPSFGAASVVFDDAGGHRVEQSGVALQLRLSDPISEHFDANVNVTWGLTDWERAREWIDAGNSSGSWTTEKIESVADWVGEGGDSQPLRFMAAIFAEFVLVATYAAVPFCYVGSVGGADEPPAVRRDRHGLPDPWRGQSVGRGWARRDHAAGPVPRLELRDWPGGRRGARRRAAPRRRPRPLVARRAQLVGARRPERHDRVADGRQAVLTW